MGQLLSLPHVLHYEQRAAEDAAGLLALGRAVADLAQRFLDRSNPLGQVPELGRLEREGAVGAGYCSTRRATRWATKYSLDWRDLAMRRVAGFREGSGFKSLTFTLSTQPRPRSG